MDDAHTIGWQMKPLIAQTENLKPDIFFKVSQKKVLAQ